MPIIRVTRTANVNVFKANPEFVRNLWLEFSRHRLIATPLLLLIIFYIAGSVAGAPGIMDTAVIGFCAFAVFWGSQQSSSAYTNELDAGTWALQRLTAISPWSMTWGKMLGAASFAWYGALQCLAVLWIANWARDPTDHVSTLIGNSVMLTSGFLLGAGLFMNAAGLHAALLRNLQRPRRKQRASRLAILAFFAIALITLVIKAKRAVAGDLAWWNGVWSAEYFWLISVYVFAAWTLVGALMLMRKEMQLKNHPTSWIVFLIFANIYVAGFVQLNQQFSDSVDLSTLRFFVATAITAGIAYFLVFFERTSVVDVGQLIDRIRRGQFNRAACEIPRWFITALLTVLIAVALVINLAFVGAKPLPALGDPIILTIASLFFMARDFGVVIYFQFSARADRALITAMIYFIVLYGLLPWLIALSDLQGILFLFFPDARAPFALGLVAPLLQAAALWYMVARRWRVRTSAPRTHGRE